jgi:UDP-3-O-[3-hydroxymyristoyl] glucosamine N-acyltransferase
MVLSALTDYAAISVLRDGRFENLGWVSQRQEHVLVFLESARFLGAVLRNNSISAVLTTAQLAESLPEVLAVGVCEHPRLAFAAIHNELARRGFYWDDFATVIDPGARVHPAAWVAAKNVRIGPGTAVAPHATILERCILGAEVVVGAGCVLGGVGFQTARANRAMLELEHAGGLMVEDRVRLLPGAVVATGLFRQFTTLARDARIGSQAFLSHGVRVGERAFVGHGAVLNGGVTVGRDAWIGPGAVIAQELDVGDEAFVSLGAAVIRSVPAKSHVSGGFAIPHRRQLRFLAGLESDRSPR